MLPSQGVILLILLDYYYNICQYVHVLFIDESDHGKLLHSLKKEKRRRPEMVDITIAPRLDRLVSATEKHRGLHCFRII